MSAATAHVPFFRAARRRRAARKRMDNRIDRMIASSEALRTEASETLEAITTRVAQNHIAEAIAEAFYQTRSQG